MKLVQQNASNLNFKGKDDLNYMRLGAAKLSYFTDFGIHENIEDLLSEYKDFFRDRVNENKNAIVTSFIDRDFQKIWPLVQDNEEKVKDGFQHTVLLVATYLKSQKAVTQPG